MIRKATIKDIKVIHKLLEFYGERGELLARPLTELYDHLRDFSVFEAPRERQVLGCCALQFCWEDLAEIRSLAVRAENTGRQIGSQLVTHALSEATGFNIARVFTLTYRPAFFERFGFRQVDRSKLPLKIWSGCLNCVKFPHCDETAMVKTITRKSR